MLTLPLSQGFQTHTWCICSTFRGPKSCPVPPEHWMPLDFSSLFSWGKTASCILLKNAKWAILYSQLWRQAHKDQRISQHKLYRGMEYGTTVTFQTCKLMPRHQTTGIPTILNIFNLVYASLEIKVSFWRKSGRIVIYQRTTDTSIITLWGWKNIILFWKPRLVQSGQKAKDFYIAERFTPDFLFCGCHVPHSFGDTQAGTYNIKGEGSTSYQ